MKKRAKEWLKQAVYDIETADILFHGGRYFYVVFFCHLSIEKALKGLYQKRLRRMAPKTHNFTYLLRKSEVYPPEEFRRFLVMLNGASIVTRYPENVEKLINNYSHPVVRDILKKSKEVLEWIENQYSES